MQRSVPRLAFLGHVPDGVHKFFTETVEIFVENCRSRGDFPDFAHPGTICTNMVRGTPAGEQHIIGRRVF
jgi:hypothetical protein